MVWKTDDSRLTSHGSRSSHAVTCARIGPGVTRHHRTNASVPTWMLKPPRPPWYICFTLDGFVPALGQLAGGSDTEAWILVPGDCTPGSLTTIRTCQARGQQPER